MCSPRCPPLCARVTRDRVDRAHGHSPPNLPGAAKPIVHRNYDGRPIVLPDDATQRLIVETISHLREAIGQDVIPASGTTPLGADDKPGVAIIINTARN
jgi:tripeptide aminopeptidase